jgi:hypothetical protein
VVEAHGRSSGVEMIGNTVYGGNGALAGGGGSAAAVSQANRVLARSDAVPPRPQPEVPSIYEWQQRTLKR